jgi:hypothetical protein
MLRGEAAVEIPERADRRFALCAALVHHLWRMDDRARAIALFVHIGTKLPSDAAAMVMLDAMRAGPPEAGQWLTQHPGFPAWEKLHGRAFAAGLPAANAMADAILTEPG